MLLSSRVLSRDTADELPADMVAKGWGEPRIKFKHAISFKKKSTYCDGEIDGLTLLPSRSAYRHHYQMQHRQRSFLFDEWQDCREPTPECEEEFEEETVLSEKGKSQVWGFSQAMPGMRYLYLNDCESSFSCLIPRILTMSSVTCRKES